MLSFITRSFQSKIEVTLYFLYNDIVGSAIAFHTNGKMQRAEVWCKLLEFA